MPSALNNTGGRTSGSKIGDAEGAAKECAGVEVDLMELAAAYEQYFLGMERRPPTIKHNDLKKRVAALRNTFINSTPVKFRIQNLQQRVTTFERLWERTLMEIENGTYKRDLFKARRHNEQKKQRSNGAKKSDGLDDLHIDEDLDLSDLDSDDGDLAGAMAAASAAVEKPKAPPGIAPLIPNVAPLVPTVSPAVGGRTTGSLPAITSPLGTGARPAVTGANAAFKPAVTGANPALKPAGAPSRPPAPVGSEGGLNEQKIKAIYDAYVMAKKRCGEDTSKLSLSSVATTLRSQVPTLMKQHNAKSVEFKVVIKDGKAVLRALPKE
ncbi:MAG: MXAN_5187 C-terminal domain-containing protein [Myxococcales bacterium]|nr:MXAN_5187 C-terminal domain-containing protein [Myxococcales bacterium]